MRDHLKPATHGLISQDIDYVVFLNDDRFFLAEEKTSERARVSPPQAVIAKMMSDILAKVTEGFLGYFLIYAISEECTRVRLRDVERDFHSFIRGVRAGETFISNWFEEVIEENFDRLWDCRGRSAGSKTASERSGSRPSNLGKVLDNYSLEHFTVDWVLLNYCTGYFILITESGINRRLIYIDHLLRRYNESEEKAFNPKSGATYEYLGLYSLEFHPNDEDIRLNGRSVSEEELVYLLNLESRGVERLREA